MSLNLSANMRATTEVLVKAFDGRWSAEAAIAPRAPTCVHTALPSSLGVPKRNNEEFGAYIKSVSGLINDAKMTIDDYVADPSKRQAVCRSSMSATTPVGPFTNEYIWFLTFDESGEKCVSVTEFMDSKGTAELLSKLAEAGHMPEH